MIRVLVAEDMAVMRDVIHKIVAQAENIEIACELTDFDGMVRELSTGEYDIILMDDYVHPYSNAEAARKLREKGIGTPIIVMGVHEEAEQLGRTLPSGVSGIIFKKELLQELTPAIRAVIGGRNYLSPLAKEIVSGR